MNSGLAMKCLRPTAVTYFVKPEVHFDESLSFKLRTPKWLESRENLWAAIMAPIRLHYIKQLITRYISDDSNESPIDIFNLEPTVLFMQEKLTSCGTKAANAPNKFIFQQANFRASPTTIWTPLSRRCAPRGMELWERDGRKKYASAPTESLPTTSQHLST